MEKVKRFNQCLIFTMFILLLSCEENNPINQEEPDVVSDIVTELNLSTGTNIQSISFTTNKTWEASLYSPQGDTSWCTISPKSGNFGSVNINITTTENTTYDDRNVVLTIKTGKTTKTINITQKQKNAIIITKNNFELPYVGGSFEIEANTNVELEFIIPSDVNWIRPKVTVIRAMSLKKIFFIVDANSNTTKREAKIILKDKNSALSSEIHIIQEANKTEQTVNLSTNETLKMKLANDLNIIEKLTITGSISSDDLHTIRLMPKLYYLDISNAFLYTPYQIEKSIKNDQFANITNLQTIILPQNTTSIEYRAFEGCTGLTSITIPNNFTRISPEAFKNCTGLKSIVLSNNVTDISSVFKGCTGLTSFIIPNTVQNISGAFEGCTGLTSIVIPNSVKDISAAFKNCTGLTSVTFPNNLEIIGGSAFEGCKALTSITIPNSVREIHEESFSYCTELLTITLGSGLIKLGGMSPYDCLSVFGECDKLKEIHIKAQNPPTVVNKCNLPSNKNFIKLFVPIGCKGAYEKFTSGWGYFQEYIEE